MKLPDNDLNKKGPLGFFVNGPLGIFGLAIALLVIGTVVYSLVVNLF